MTGREAMDEQEKYAPLAASECCEGLPCNPVEFDGLHCVGDCAEVPTDKIADTSAKLQGNVSSNPKDIAAAGKCPLWLIPPVAEYIEARVLEHGAAKYGAYNWRREAIQLSNYLSAIRRHLGAYIDGENIDPESGLNHLAHARATLGIILDAQMHGKVIDDRPKG